LKKSYLSGWGRRTAGIAAAAGLALTVPLSGSASAAEASAPIVEGLTGPLGLSVGADGTIYVAEAAFASETFEGKITTVDRKGRVKTLVEDVVGGAIDAHGKGQVAYAVALPPEAGEEAPGGTLLKRVLPNGNSSTSADMYAYEETVNPDQGNTYGFVGLEPGCAAQVPPFLLGYGGIVDSNPYSVAIAGNKTYVAEAAGNAINVVTPNGSIDTVAVLPPIPQPVTAETKPAIDALLAEEGLPPLPDCTIGSDYLSEPVPTDVEVGPDGNLYVSSLPGAPELPGYGSVWRVNPASGAVTLVAGGLSGAVDLAVADDGTIYVAELFAETAAPFPGAISRIDPTSGAVSTYASVVTPGAVEWSTGTLYATVDVFGNGAVVTIG
jgi:hypothetical protein